MQRRYFWHHDGHRKREKKRRQRRAESHRLNVYLNQTAITLSFTPASKRRKLITVSALRNSCEILSKTFSKLLKMGGWSKDWNETEVLCSSAARNLSYSIQCWSRTKENKSCLQSLMSWDWRKTFLWVFFTFTSGKSNQNWIWVLKFSFTLFVTVVIFLLFFRE